MNPYIFTLESNSVNPLEYLKNISALSEIRDEIFAYKVLTRKKAASFGNFFSAGITHRIWNVQSATQTNNSTFLLLNENDIRARNDIENGSCCCGFFFAYHPKWEKNLLIQWHAFVLIVSGDAFWTWLNINERAIFCCCCWMRWLSKLLSTGYFLIGGNTPLTQIHLCHYASAQNRFLRTFSNLQNETLETVYVDVSSMAIPLRNVSTSKWNANIIFVIGFVISIQKKVENVRCDENELCWGPRSRRNLN